VMALFRMLSDSIFRLEKILVNIILIIMLVSMVLGVLFRYVLNAPLTWSGEITIFALVWVTFIGGSMSIKKQQAVAVTLLTDKLTGNARKIVIVLGLFLSVVFTVILCCLSIKWILSPNIFVQKSDSIQVPMIYAYLSVPVGILFMAIHSIHLFLESLWKPEEKVNA
jgi:TRAP-type C4-dicarboxylate transport system permease small subunit